LALSQVLDVRQGSARLAGEDGMDRKEWKAKGESLLRRNKQVVAAVMHFVPAPPLIHLVFDAVLPRMVRNREYRRLRGTRERFQFTFTKMPAQFGFDQTDFQPLLKYICNVGFEHHCAMSPSTTADVVAEALGNYLQWEVYRHE
jgi:hypothetical protein